MRRRAIGQETEYGFFMLVDGKPVFPDSLSEIFGLCDYETFLRTGARFYFDVHTHPEYATPECDSPQQLVAHALAGDELLAERAKAYVEAHSTEDKKTKIYIYRNNVCSFEGADTTFGTHENYQTEPLYSIEDFMRPFMAYLVTRQLVLGAGRYRRWKDGTTSFELAQRSGFFYDDYSINTTTSRPIVNLRNEPHAENCTRLHVITGDNNLLPQNTELKFASMCVLITLREERRLKHLELANPVTAIQAISRNPAERVDLAGSGSWTALDIQKFYFDQGHDLVYSDSEFTAMRPYFDTYGRHLERLTDSLDLNEPEAHEGQLCWATKAAMLNRLAKPTRRRKARTAEQRRWDELSMQEIVDRRSLRQIIMKRFGEYDQAAVDLARTEPPATTRAYPRGLLIALGEEVTAVNWESVTLKGGKKYELSDPLSTELPDHVYTGTPTPIGPQQQNNIA